MIYPQKLNSKKGDIILKVFILVSIFLAILLVIINKLTTESIPWAALANGGIVYIWVTVFYSIRKNINIAGHVLLQTIEYNNACLNNCQPQKIYKICNIPANNCIVK